MRKITAIPSKKIAFKNVPISGLFFLKRTLYQKNSSHEGKVYNCNKCVFFQDEEIVRFITKMHENIAIEVIENRKLKKLKKVKQKSIEFNINDTIEIIDKLILGKIVSVNKDTCLVQYKEEGIVSFCEFNKRNIRKIKM